MFRDELGLETNIVMNILNLVKIRYLSFFIQVIFLCLFNLYSFK